MTTIFALSSGAAPAGIAVIRVTGPAAAQAVLELAGGKLPEARRAVRRIFTTSDAQPIDDGILLWFPGPASVTGEDVAEFHLHGGRAVIAAMEAALSALPRFHRAEPGEFTRRAFANGRIDLAEAEGLADLLSAETEIQRRAAMEMAGGLLSRRVEAWREDLLTLSAEVEAVLDFDDEDDVAGLDGHFVSRLHTLRENIRATLDSPSAETLREGFRVALAGPPNAGKSTLFNVLVESEAAITAPVAGTTRDVLIRWVALEGIPFAFVDMAGLRAEGGDAVEAIGIDRARREIERADIVLWLGPEGEGPPGAWELEAQIDRCETPAKDHPDFRLSARTGAGMETLTASLVDKARSAMPRPGQAAISERQRMRMREALAALDDFGPGVAEDPLIVAENLRGARAAFDALIGRTSTEDMLDMLFGRFCIGK